MYTESNRSEKKATKDKPIQAMNLSLIENKSTASDNNTDIPTQMKDSIEQRSGLSFGDVRVHYNSPKPAQRNAHVYTHGNDIHIASGQERHLGYELGHVVQQKQSLVKPSNEFGDLTMSDDVWLERGAGTLTQFMVSEQPQRMSDAIQMKNGKRGSKSQNTREVRDRIKARDAALEGGRLRREQHGGNWQVANWRNVIDLKRHKQLSGSSGRNEVGGKLIFHFNTGYQVIIDIDGRYWRWQNAQEQYLDINGNPSLVNQATHFRTPD